MTNITAEKGSISQGSNNPEVLIPIFMETLVELDNEAADKWKIWTAEAIIHDIENDERFSRSKHAYELASFLEDELNNYAPSGHFFGENPSDKKNYGFWPENEGI